VHLFGFHYKNIYLHVTAARLTHWSVTVPYNTASESCIILFQMKTNGFLVAMSKNCEKRFVMSHGITWLLTDGLFWNFYSDLLTTLNFG